MKRLASRLFLQAFLVVFFPALVYAQEISSDLKIAGHRGGYYFNYPESSLSLLNYLSKQFKKDTIIAEIDLRKSKNGTIYIMHDETVDRTTTGTGKIDQLDDNYLEGLFLKKENGGITKKRIPTFEEVLQFIRKKNINLMLDIKTPIHAEAYELVKAHKMENRMLTLTFNMELTKKVATLSNKISLSALMESENDWQMFKEISMPVGKKIAYVNAKTSVLLIQELKKNNVKIMADVSEALRNSGKPLGDEGYQKKVKDQTLDILITDFPIEARKSFIKK
ncbi:MAG TPA: glycerophosphodiester phosphodiesterase family protein [Cyclobacteriaceae bacterium]|nr:glycerophosphodiester phosphodiesterase family protein [Cyclobacteriaceae bacterium]HPW60936.1 glycerophosphodiester phosphodiesterase family protein [Cyclobacteriaceae bacterium]